MSEESAAPIAELPTITIVFDPVAQNVNVKFHTKDFKILDFAIAVLGMATEAVKEQRDAQRAQRVQQQTQQAIQHEMMKRNLQVRPAR